MLSRSLAAVAFSEKFGRQIRFITGPRQTGKTVLAEAFLKSVGTSELYFNWDESETRKSYRADASFFMPKVYDAKSRGIARPWVCFDEIHKIPKWKNVLKGIFDRHQKDCRLIVTGSARLDLLKYTGESLLGRYFTFRLLPLRLAEISGGTAKSEWPQKPPDAETFLDRCLSQKPASQEALQQLIQLSGFPEPFLSGEDVFVRKWRQDYLNHYVREDLRDLTEIAEIEKCFHLVELLPSRIGNPLSLNALREDLEVSHTAVRTWLKALSLTYVVFSLSPFSKKVARSVKKEQKYYFYDWTQVIDPGARFENYLAVELLSFCSLLTDSGLGLFDLHFVRTRDGKETDFLITREKKPWLLIEAKLAEEQMSRHHQLHAAQLGGVPVVQVVQKKDVLRIHEKNLVTVSANRFLGGLGIS